MHLLHRWGPWGESFRFGFDLYQRRRCLKCGKETTRRVGWRPSA